VSGADVSNVAVAIGKVPSRPVFEGALTPGVSK
jgi:hypothetical protein